MRNLILYLSLILAALLVLNVILPQWLPIRYPRALGPVFSADVRMSYQTQIQKEKPEVILLGNSVINSGIDLQLFERIINRKTVKFSNPGTASAYWYLLMKSNIVTSNPPPGYLLIFFLDNLLTSPELGVTGAYQVMIDEVAGENEEVLLQKAYLNQINPVESYLDSHLPVFGERDTLKEKIDNRLKYSLPFAVENCDKTCLDAALDQTFTQLNMIQDNFAQTTVNVDPWSGRAWDFDTLVDKSFIPDMIQLANEKGIQLIFIREKNAKVMNLSDESADMRRYFQEMAAYLSKHGIYFFDFAHESALTLDMFRDGMHLGPAGQQIFTRLVAERFSALIR
jgi:hypothetical protein